MKLEIGNMGNKGNSGNLGNRGNREKTTKIPFIPYSPYTILTIYLTFFVLNYSGFAGNNNLISSKAQNNQNQGEYEDYTVKNEDIIYKDNIKTVLLYKNSFEFSQPIITLFTNEKLKLSFDDLIDVVKTYKYTLIHCDANWETSEIQQNEYIEGFTEDFIEDYKFSFNTIIPYIHYELIFPTQYLKPTLSGNYILKVYLDNDEDENVAFTLRLMIVNPKVVLEAKVKRAIHVQDMDYKQEIDFWINTNGFYISTPYKDLKVILRQNGRWDNIINNLEPRIINRDQLDYNYDGKIVFNGGNEFRDFDFKSMKYNSERIRKIDREYDAYDIFLRDDVSRPYKIYISEKDINGKKFIKTEDSNDSDIEAEYANVHFSLPYQTPLYDGNLYVFGSLTNWNFTKAGLMKFNFDNHHYETTMLLKQGYYEYVYMFLKKGSKTGDVTFIEGNHYETSNDYSICVYYRKPGTFYDKLIAVKEISFP
jgi:hypothetical protein